MIHIIDILPLLTLPTHVSIFAACFLFVSQPVATISTGASRRLAAAASAAAAAAAAAAVSMSDADKAAMLLRMDAIRAESAVAKFNAVGALLR